MTDPMPDDALTLRTGLPDSLRVLTESLPRSDWEAHPNFDGLTRFWMERHLMFREVLDRLQKGSAAFLDGKVEDRAFGQETARYANFLLNQLHEHHHIEDHHYFPQLRALEPRLERGFEILDRDHHALDGVLHGLATDTQAALKSLGTPDQTDATGRLHKQLLGFETFLDRHLVDEEDLIVPVILKHGLG